MQDLAGSPSPLIKHDRRKAVFGAICLTVALIGFAAPEALAETSNATADQAATTKSGTSLPTVVSPRESTAPGDRVIQPGGTMASARSHAAAKPYVLGEAVHRMQPASAAVKAIVDKSSRGQVRAISVFPGPDGMTGVVIKAGNGSKSVVWEPAGGGYVLVGYLFDGSGGNLTVEAKQALGLGAGSGGQGGNHGGGGGTQALIAGLVRAGQNPGVAPPRPEAGVAKAVAKAHFTGFDQGHGPVHITAVIDPNCIFCHRLWQSLQSMPDWQSRFTIRWVPVGFLKPSSLGKAAAVLDGGINALNTDESGFNDNTETGAIKPSDNAKALAEVGRNTSAWGDMMRNLGQQAGTPTLVIADGYVVPGALPAQVLTEIGKALSHKAASTKPAPVEIRMPAASASPSANPTTAPTKAPMNETSKPASAGSAQANH